MRLFDPTYPPIPWPVLVEWGKRVPCTHKPQHNYAGCTQEATWLAYWREYTCGPGFKSRWHAILAVMLYRFVDKRMGYWDNRAPQWYERVRGALWE